MTTNTNQNANGLFAVDSETYRALTDMLTQLCKDAKRLVDGGIQTPQVHAVPERRDGDYGGNKQPDMIRAYWTSLSCAMLNELFDEMDSMDRARIHDALTNVSHIAYHPAPKANYLPPQERARRKAIDRLASRTRSIFYVDAKARKQAAPEHECKPIALTAEQVRYVGRAAAIMT